MELQEIIKAVQAELPKLSDSKIIDLIDGSGIAPELYTPGHVASLVKSAKRAAQGDGAISPVSKTPVKQVTSAPIVAAQTDLNLKAELARMDAENREEEQRIDAEIQRLESGEIAPVLPNDLTANPTTIAKIELPEDNSGETLAAELEGCFVEGTSVADLKLKAMVAGHDIRMRQGVQAIVGRRVNPFSNLGEIKLEAPDFGKPIELTNPFVEGV